MKQFPNIPGYKIEQQLARGRIADVYLAVRRNTNERVIVKVLKSELLGEQRFATQLLVEAGKAAQLEHPNINRIIDIGETRSHDSYFVSDHYTESLRDWINEKHHSRPGAADEIDPHFALDVVKQVASALAYAHKTGAVHGDLRPESIYLKDEKTIVITDFYVSQFVEAFTSLRKKGIDITLPHYTSPERALRKDTSGSSDIYCLGITFYEMLAGKVPYMGASNIEIENQHIMEPVPQLPRNFHMFQPLLEKMMAKIKEERIQTGFELIQNIDQVFNQMTRDGLQDVVVKNILGQPTDQVIEIELDDPEDPAEITQGPSLGAMIMADDEFPDTPSAGDSLFATPEARGVAADPGDLVADHPSSRTEKPSAADALFDMADSGDLPEQPDLMDLAQAEQLSDEPVAEGQNANDAMFEAPDQQQVFELGADEVFVEPTADHQRYEPANNDAVFAPPAEQQLFEPTGNDAVFEPTPEQQVFEPTGNDAVFAPPEEPLFQQPEIQGELIGELNPRSEAEEFPPGPPASAPNNGVLEALDNFAPAEPPVAELQQEPQSFELLTEPVSEAQIESLENEKLFDAMDEFDGPTKNPPPMATEQPRELIDSNEISAEELEVRQKVQKLETQVDENEISAWTEMQNFQQVELVEDDGGEDIQDLEESEIYEPMEELDIPDQPVEVINAPPPSPEQIYEPVEESEIPDQQAAQDPAAYEYSVTGNAEQAPEDVFEPMEELELSGDMVIERGEMENVVESGRYSISSNESTIARDFPKVEATAYAPPPGQGEAKELLDELDDGLQEEQLTEESLEAVPSGQYESYEEEVLPEESQPDFAEDELPEEELEPVDFPEDDLQEEELEPALFTRDDVGGADEQDDSRSAFKQTRQETRKQLIAEYIEKIKEPKIWIPAVGAIVVLVVLLIFFGPFGGSDEDIQPTDAKTATAQKKPEKKKPKLTERQLKRLEANYARKMKQAKNFLDKKQYSKALSQLKLAGKLKETDDVKALQKQVTEKIEFEKDDGAFTKASATDSLAAYEEYMTSFPSGRHAEEVQNKLEEIKKLELLAKEEERKLAKSRIKLRSTYQNLTKAEARVMVKERNLFDKYYNERGDFPNVYESRSINNHKVVVDKGSGLMWHQAGTNEYMGLENAKKWIESLNNGKYGGFSNWRLPTLEEALSILENKENKWSLYIDESFSNECRYIWTGDSSDDQFWVVDFFGGDINQVELKNEAYVRPVRSML
ncbi:MAG: protein kinase [bacterium]|nr:protein kinase [bacterium]